MPSRTLHRQPGKTGNTGERQNIIKRRFDSALPHHGGFETWPPDLHSFDGSTEQTAPSRAGYPGNTERNGLEMSIKEATPDEITALRERISRRQMDRRYEMEMDQAVAMASKANRHPIQPAPTVKVPDRESVIVATGTAMIAGTAAILSGAGAIPMGYAAITASVALAGAAVEVVRTI